MDNAGLRYPADLEAAPREHFEHPIVIAEHVGFELADTALMRDTPQVFQQNRSDPAPLMVVEHGEGHFGPRRLGQAHVARNTDEPFVALFTQRRHQPDMVYKIELREPG